MSNNRSTGHSGDQPPLERVVIVIDDLDRCAPENVVKVLEAVHLLFDFEMFVVVLAVDMRWLDQSLKVHYRQLLGESGTASPSDYLEKIIQVPVQLSELDEALVMRMIFGLAKQGLPEPTAAESPERHDTGAHVAAPTDKAQQALTAERQRPTRAPLPARVLEISPGEAAALSSVAALVGTTPRTVKRFVNTFQLIKARSQDPASFADPLEIIAPGPSGTNSPDPVGAVSPAEIVAFLLAVLTGRSAAADLLFRELASTSDEGTLQSAGLALKTRPPNDGSGADPSPASNRTRSLEQSIEEVNGWLAQHPRLASAKIRDAREWVREVARFSFTRTTLT